MASVSCCVVYAESAKQLVGLARACWANGISLEKTTSSTKKMAMASSERERREEGGALMIVRTQPKSEGLHRHNFNLRYWSWNDDGCWHQTCPPNDTRNEIFASVCHVMSLPPCVRIGYFVRLLRIQNKELILHVTVVFQIPARECFCTDFLSQHLCKVHVFCYTIGSR